MRNFIKINKMEQKVSVIIPIYKVEKYLIQCVESVINQTYKNIEIILVDDGSPDNCGKICDKYAKSDDRIIVIHQENKGLSCARNAGIEIATGTYIAFLDSDDHLNLSMIEIMLKYILNHNLEVLEIEPKHSNLKSNNVFDNTFTIEDPVTASKRILTGAKFAVWRRMYKRTLIEDMRFIPRIISEDVFYTMDLLKRITRYGHLNSAFYNYNLDSISIIRSKYSSEKITVAIRATEYITQNVIEHPELKKIVSNYITHYFTDHFFLLSRNTSIDPDKNFRKKIKKNIKKNISYRNANFRTMLVILMPYKIMELISSSYKSIILSKGQQN